LTRYKNFKEGHKRILVATDLVGRGIDIERVNIVVNYDMPDSADTYLHRVIVALLEVVIVILLALPDAFSSAGWSGWTFWYQGTCNNICFFCI
jgi:hypothetical protein